MAPCVDLPDGSVVDHRGESTRIEAPAFREGLSRACLVSHRRFLGQALAVELNPGGQDSLGHRSKGRLPGIVEKCAEAQVGGVELARRLAAAARRPPG
eukprot:7300505-Pyramimonas_sp.AAC.1